MHTTYESSSFDNSPFDFCESRGEFSIWWTLPSRVEFVFRNAMRLSIDDGIPLSSTWVDVRVSLPKPEFLRIKWTLYSENDFWLDSDNKEIELERVWGKEHDVADGIVFLSSFPRGWCALDYGPSVESITFEVINEWETIVHER